MQLTQHFSLAEFQRSATATRHGIDNSIPESLIPSLQTLCEQVLEPLRKYAGRPVTISSGYRCAALNKAVGGVSSSQHCRGEAADIAPSQGGKDGEALLRHWFSWIESHTNYDQLLYEHSGTKVWIHVSCKRDISHNRHQVMRVEGQVTGT